MNLRRPQPLRASSHPGEALACAAASPGRFAAAESMARACGRLTIGSMRAATDELAAVPRRAGCRRAADMHAHRALHAESLSTCIASITRPMPRAA